VPSHSKQQARSDAGAHRNSGATGQICYSLVRRMVVPT
jgi:hypothetical protein